MIDAVASGAVALGPSLEAVHALRGRRESGAVGRARKTHENDADAASLQIGAGVGDVVGSGVGSLEVGEGVGSLEVGAGVGDVVGSGVGDVVGSGVGSLEEFPLRSTGRPCALRLLRRQVAASDACRPRRALRDWG